MSIYSHYYYNAYRKSLGRYESYDKTDQSIDYDSVDPPISMDIIRSMPGEFVIVSKLHRFGDYGNARFDYIIFRNCVLEDIVFNGWSFPSHIETYHVWDHGSHYDLECLTPSGKLLKFNTIGFEKSILDMFEYISKFKPKMAEFLIPLQSKLRVNSFNTSELIQKLEQVEEKINEIEKNETKDNYILNELKLTYNEILDKIQKKISQINKYELDDEDE